MADSALPADVVRMAIEHRRPRRFDVLLNPWFLMLELAPDDGQFGELLAARAGARSSRLGFLALRSVCRVLQEALASLGRIRCYRCGCVQTVRNFCHRWQHVFFRLGDPRRCEFCLRHGEVCGDLPHPSCQGCILAWDPSDASD